MRSEFENSVIRACQCGDVDRLLHISTMSAEIRQTNLTTLELVCLALVHGQTQLAKMLPVVFGEIVHSDLLDDVEIRLSIAELIKNNDLEAITLLAQLGFNLDFCSKFARDYFPIILLFISVCKSAEMIHLFASKFHIPFKHIAYSKMRFLDHILHGHERERRFDVLFALEECGVRSENPLTNCYLRWTPFEHGATFLQPTFQTTMQTLILGLLKLQKEKNLTRVDPACLELDVFSGLRLGECISMSVPFFSPNEN